MDDLCAMKEWQRTRLDNYLMVITTDLDIKDTILKLKVRNLINADDEQLILNDSVHRVDSEKRQKIVDIIKTRGEKAYWAFCHIVKNKTPFIFDILHKCDRDDEDVEKICPNCIGKEDMLKCCDNCSGLINVLSNPEFGVFVERPEEIIEAFQCNQNQKELLSTEVEQHKSENEKLNNINLELVNSKSELLSQLETQEKQLAERQKEIEDILKQKEDSNIEKETLSVSNDDLKRKIEVLESEVEENKETIRKLDEDPIYENYNKVRVESLEHDVSRKDDQIKTYFQTITERDSVANSYKRKYETLEEIVQRQKLEHDRVFTLLQNKLQYLEKSVKDKEEEIKGHKEYVMVINNEKNEAIKEKDHLLHKVYEKNDLLKQTQVIKDRLEQDKASFENLYLNQQKTNKQLESTIEGLYQENKKLNQEYEGLRQQFNGVQESSRRRKLTAVENDEDDEIFLPDNKFKKLEEENILLKNNIIRKTDKTIVLKKIGDIFGIKFGMKRGPLLLGESRIIITSLSESHLVSTNVNVEENDYVILVNNYNVQEADINVVRNCIAKNNESMNLVIRKPARQVPTVKSVKLNHIILDKFNDLGIRLAVSVAVEKSSVTRECGLLAMDEVVKINNKSAETLSIVDISKLITKCVKQRQCDLTVNRYTSITDEEIEGRQRMGLNLSPDRTLPREQQPPPAEANDSIDDSPLSPDGKPKLPPRGISASLPNLLDSPADPADPADPAAVHQYTENYATGNYQRVVTKEYDSKGDLLNDSTVKIYENKLVTVDVIKEGYEAFGLHITGGNKTGIYVEAVDNWKPAQKANIQVGWRLLQINRLSLERVAFCYANEVLQKFLNDTKVNFKFEATSMEYYKKMMKKRPYDAFHIKTLVDYTARDSTELSFKAGEILRVDDSYVMDNPSEPYKWQATKDDGTMTVSGFIPRQISNRAPSSVMEHKYEEIDPPTPESPQKQQKNLLYTLTKKKNSPGPDRLYKILEPVGEVLV